MHLFGIRQNSLPIKINRQVSHPTLIDVYRGSMALRMRFRESDHCIQIRKFVKYPQLQNILQARQEFSESSEFLAQSVYICLSAILVF